MKQFLVRALVVTLLCVAIAVLLMILGIGPLWHNVAISLAIGWVAMVVPPTLARAVPSIADHPLVYVSGIPFGAVAGILVHALWLHPDGEGFERLLAIVLSTAIIFGLLVGALFFFQARKKQLEEDLHAAELRRLEAERGALEAQLKMLQAQIEPHFLFNTLANVAALISTDPALARRLLDRLIVYLRAALARTRAGSTTLGDEIDLLRAYLDICRIRMGERLRYTVDVPAELLAHPFPPMLLQPLVENAVKHGLEPKPTSGEVRITATNGPANLQIAVVDDGVGFGRSAGSGTGVANVTARLAALYGKEAKLTMEGNPSGGVTAILELPA